MIEYRICCGLFGSHPWHSAHRYAVSAKRCATEAGRAELLAARDADPVMRQAGNVGCVPWHIEARHVGGWTRDVELVEALERLEKDGTPVRNVPTVSEGQGTLWTA